MVIIDRKEKQMIAQALRPADFEECLHVIDDKASGVQGVIAIHSMARGPAAGGCRFWHYDSPAAMHADAVRLARGMSYKNAMADLPFGGGKAVLRRPTGSFDRATVFRVFADAVAALDGAYITAEDVGTSIADMKAVRERTRYVAGLEPRPGKAGGDPSPWTALGIFESMKATTRFALGSELKGLTVAVQGTGNVGMHLCRLLADAGAKLIVADVDRHRVEQVTLALGARAVSVEEIIGVEADVFAPCALGGVLDAASIPRLRARIVCGGANNQLATESDGQMLLDRGITYAPDYVVNAGGIINVAAEYLGETPGQVHERVRKIPDRLQVILARAAAVGEPTNIIADGLARQIIADARPVPIHA